MAETRRNILKVLGGGGVIIAAGGGAWALTRDPKAARQPWRDAASLYDDPMRNALSYAILAPNPHNRQPWVVDLRSPTEAVLYCDLDRLLPETDPFNRQITIGLGCFLEIFRIAAAQKGQRVEISPFPEGGDETAIDNRPVAHIRLSADDAVAKDPFFAAVLDRRTDHSKYDVERPLIAEEMNAMEDAATSSVRSFVIDDDAQVRALRELTWRAWLVEVETPNAHLESVHLMRIGKKEIENSPDGISLGGPLMEAMCTFGVITRESLADPTSSAFSQARDFMKPGVESAMGYACIATDGNNRTQQVAAGADYVRMNLAATLHGVSMQPMSQALQEYSEMEALFQEVHEMLAAPGETLQMLARIGYGSGAPAAPRWPLETRIKST